MSTSKHFDFLCLISIFLALVLTFCCFGLAAATEHVLVMGYETKLFDPSRVHTIDIVIDDWEGFLDTCESETYTDCSLIIDGETFRNVGIRGKGNTSLSSVASMDSQRYSLKVEFDHYATGNNYHGLDKLSLNNLIYDNTMMKDYLVYQMMQAFGAASPLSSFVYITVNGEDFGLYLAAEGVEDSFLARNYGNDHGELYKPDSMNFGGGRGNGRAFNMDNFAVNFAENMQEGFPPMPDAGNFPADFELQEAAERPAEEGKSNTEPRQFTERSNTESRGGFGGGMGSEDVKLQYIDDDPSSYSNIFNSAKTDITDADKARLIQALKTVSESENPQEALFTEDLMRYFVVHNYAVNGDSYTGSMVHNYYLYEQDGKLSMLPWDYNLAFGTFHGSDGQSSVNDPIDTPQNTGASDRPLIDWILEDEEQLSLYHNLFSQFLDSIDIQAMIEEAYALITPYVEDDPTKFCTTEEFHAGVQTLKTFCRLRSESIEKQLSGAIPATSDGQQAAPDTLVDTSTLEVSKMGSMGGGRGGSPDSFGGHGRQKDPFPAVQTTADISIERSPRPTASLPQEAPPIQERTKPLGEMISAAPWLSVSTCCAFLLLAILFAARYKRRK